MQPRAILLVRVLVLSLLPLAAHALDPQRRFDQLAHDRWSMDDGLPFPGGYHLAQDAQGYLWLGSIAGLARFDGQRFVVHDSANTPAMRGNLIRGLATDAAGRLWIGSERGVLFVQDGRFVDLPALAGRNVHVLGADAEGAMLLGDGDNVLRVRADLGLEPVAALSDVHLYIDHGGAWFAATDGLYRATADGHQAQQLPGLGHGHVGALLAHHGNLLAGTTNGLYRLVDGHWLRDGHPGLHRRILAMTGDDQGTAWISTELSLFRLQHGQVVETIDVSAIAPATRAILVDTAGSLWLASHADGLHRLWDGIGDYLPIPYDLSSAQFMWAVAVWDGQVHTGGTYGLTRLADGRQQPIPASAGLPAIYSLFGEPGQLWLGSVRGVFRYDGKQVGAAPGLEALADTRTNAFLRDRDGRLWLGTARGLYRSGAQGLQRLAGTDNSTRWEIRTLLQTRQGTVYAGGNQGLWRVHDDALVEVALPGPAHGVQALLELDGGRLLAGSRTTGALYLHAGGQWRVLDQGRGIPRNEVYALVADDQGGVLVSGLRGAYHLPARQLALAVEQPTAMLQVQPGLTLHRRDSPGQQAVCCVGGGDGRALLHQGRYYLPSSQGLYTLPWPLPGTVGRSVPRIERIQTQRQLHLPTGAPLQLGADERELRIAFSVLNLSPLHWPRLLYRLDGYEDSWQELPAQANPFVRYTNLPAGSYRFQVTDAASGAQVASQALEIAPAFHETPYFAWLLALASLAFFGLSLWLGNGWHRRQHRRLEALVHDRTRDLAHVNARLDALARTDPLTGLYNRRHAAHTIPQRLAGTADGTLAGCQHLFVLLDVDHFKAINDRHGHEAGDAVLVEVARRLGQQLRQGDCLARWGGEEFLMVCFDLAPGEHAAIAERLLAAINRTPVTVPGTAPLAVTVSLGLALCGNGAATESGIWKRCIRQADAALYASKAAGRNRWQLAADRPG